MRVLLLSPHPDDIELGAGGTVVKLLENGADICWAVFSLCEDTAQKEMPKDTFKKEFLGVLSALKITKNHIYNFDNKNFPARRQEIMDNLVEIKSAFNPELVICPSTADVHQDHKVISEETVRIFKRDSSIVGYEQPWNNLAFKPSMFSKLTESQINKKWELLSIYKSQFIKKRNYFSKDFILGLARTRGVQCNSEFAESFEVIRWIM